MPQRKSNTAKQTAHKPANANAASQTEAIQAKASRVESLVSNRRTSASLRYALQTVLIEMSNESGIGVDQPGLAGAFYAIAASQLKDSTDETIRRCLRHLDILLSNPEAKDVKAMAKYWDEPGSSLRGDPFIDLAASVVCPKGGDAS